MTGHTRNSRQSRVPVRALLGHRPTVAFTNAESAARIEDILRPGRRFFDNTTPLTARGQRFEAVCHVRDNRLFIEIEPYVDAEHNYANMVQASLESIVRDTAVQGLYAAAARMMHFVTNYDRVKLYKFVSHGHGVVVAEHHAPNSNLPNSFLGYHFSATDIPENAKEILRTGKTRQKPTQRGSVPLLTLGPQGEVRESGQAVDMTDAWLRGIHPCDNGYNRNLGVGSNIIFPVCVDNTVWGLFVVHNRDEKFLNYDSRVVIEQLTMMFISRLIEVEAAEARMDERQLLAVQMVGQIDAGQEVLSSVSSRRGQNDGAVRMLAMYAVSRHLAALAPTYVSGNGVDSVQPGRAEDKFSSDLLRLADADGAAILRTGRSMHVHLIGTTPDAITVCGLAGLFGTRLPGFANGGGRVFATDALGDYAPISARGEGHCQRPAGRPAGRPRRHDHVVPPRTRDRRDLGRQAADRGRAQQRDDVPIALGLCRAPRAADRRQSCLAGSRGAAGRAVRAGGQRAVAALSARHAGNGIVAGRRVTQPAGLRGPP
jgi:two-component system, chemotaxis family, sensor kinase Cph1